MSYEIHVTRWERDAHAMVRRFAMDTSELLRVHVMGGSGTLFEAVNGVIGLPNAHLAVYPYGRENAFLHYFGSDKLHMFSSVRSQVLSDTLPIDVIKCGNHYCLSYGSIGLEAVLNKNSQESIERKGILPDSAAYFGAAVNTAFFDWTSAKKYRIDLDGVTLDGVYLSMLIANVPNYGKNMAPAVDAHPNDGILDIYLVSNISPLKMFMSRKIYLSGRYGELSDFISHYRGKKITIDMGDSMNTICLDGHIFYNNPIDFEVFPYAVDFVCPNGIDMEKLPRIYGRPETAEE